MIKPHTTVADNTRNMNSTIRRHSDTMDPRSSTDGVAAMIVRRTETALLDLAWSMRSFSVVQHL